MTLTITAARADAMYPMVTLTVTSSPSVTALIALYRHHQNGSRYPVLTASHDALIGGWGGFDYHAPFNQLVTYTAEAAGETSAASTGVVQDSSTLWLIHPSDPALSVLADKWITTDNISYKYPSQATQYQVLNRRLPVVRVDYPRGGERGSLAVKCETIEARAKVKALFADGGPILINTPYTDDEIGWKWVQPGELTMRNPASYNVFPWRYAEFDYEECRQPDADVRIRTYAEVKAMFPGKTYADMKLVYDTYLDAQLDHRLP